MAVINVNFNDINNKKIIDAVKLNVNTNKLDRTLISPAKEEINTQTFVEHASEPIKSLEDIYRISKYLIDNKRWRDNMLFIVGINFGLRASDLRQLRFSDIINDNLTFKESFPVFEIKTRNTRKRKKNRYITINKAVIEAVTLYLQHTSNVSLSDYLFKSQAKKDESVNKSLSVRSIDRILDGIKNDLNLNIRFSSHSLRKTFCYHQMVMSDNDPRKLVLLQKMLGHSSMLQTLDYIGITEDEIANAYKGLNLGSKKYCYLVQSDIVEYDDNTNNKEAL